jgi:hypothetical protein
VCLLRIFERELLNDVTDFITLIVEISLLPCKFGAYAHILKLFCHVYLPKRTQGRRCNKSNSKLLIQIIVTTAFN